MAVMCRTPGRAENYARRHGIPRWYTDAAALIHDREVDGVYIATPPDSHHLYTAMVARALKPVYVEKPMARNHRECEQMIKICKQQNVPLYVAYYRRRLPKFLRVQQLLRDGVIGDVRTVSVHLHWPPRPDDLSPERLPWRVIPEIAGGGYFIDLASHQLDLLDFLLGPIETAAGIKANQTGWYPAEDAVTAYFSFENGVLGSGSWCFTVNEANRLDRTEITGSRGTMIYSNFDASPIRILNEKGMQEYTEPWPEHVQLPLIQTVVEALLGEGQCPSTGMSAARTSRVMDMILGNLT
jgi:predicted dehydrogenase